MESEKNPIVVLGNVYPGWWLGKNPSEKYESIGMMRKQPKISGKISQIHGNQSPPTILPHRPAAAHHASDVRGGKYLQGGSPSYSLTIKHDNDTMENDPVGDD